MESGGETPQRDLPVLHIPRSVQRKMSLRTGRVKIILKWR
ncbi:hypothetical protein GDO78_020391 [Eleutherodactylus coqui]|uniref:Uncharacterized protein n=1 Tax=Eleutherodactylus coqui TaxID=57060 RepID=A0A8J6BDV2_ELECQ|nr:hypothetical protein GDO78_020391 [Eleutherodactylus coqui]